MFKASNLQDILFSKVFGSFSTTHISYDCEWEEYYTIGLDKDGKYLLVINTGLNSDINVVSFDTALCIEKYINSIYSFDRDIESQIYQSIGYTSEKEKREIEWQKSLNEQRKQARQRTEGKAALKEMRKAKLAVKGN
jgi:hypothetical protein